MTRFRSWRIKAGRVPEIIGAAGLISGAGGILRLLWPANYRVGDGIVSCGSVISRQSSPYPNTICSHMLGTAALIGSLLVGLGALMFVWACILALRSGGSVRVHKMNENPD